MNVANLDDPLVSAMTVREALMATLNSDHSARRQIGASANGSYEYFSAQIRLSFTVPADIARKVLQELEADEARTRKVEGVA